MRWEGYGRERLGGKGQVGSPMFEEFPSRYKVKKNIGGFPDRVTKHVSFVSSLQFKYFPFVIVYDSWSQKQDRTGGPLTS